MYHTTHHEDKQLMEDSHIGGGCDADTTSNALEPC